MIGALLLLQLVRSASPEAVDHVTTLETMTAGDVPGPARTTVYRSGPWLRVESRDAEGRETVYTNLAQGLETRVYRDRRGQIRRITIKRVRPDNRLPPTGRRRRVLGEACTVSRTVNVSGSSGEEVCDTVDGIMLWRGFWWVHDAGRTPVYQRATAIERRRVRPEEVRPPRDTLAFALEGRPVAAPAGGAGPDYEVEMAGADATDGSYVFRRHGLFFSHEGQRLGDRFLVMGNGAVSISYSEDVAGRPVDIEIRRGTPLHTGGFAGRRWERLPNRPPEHLLGETCTWQGLSPASDDHYHECRTNDGIALITEGGWSMIARRFTARRLSRATLRDSDFAPPARPLDWATWGITPAP